MQTRTDRARVFSLKLVRQMALNNLTAIDISKACGVSRQSVNKYINGNRLPSIGIIPELSAICGVQPDYWFRSDLND